MSIIENVMRVNKIIMTHAADYADNMCIPYDEVIEFIVNIPTSVYEILKDTSYLESGAYKTVFYEGDTVYAFIHAFYDEDEVAVLYDLPLKSPIFPNAERVDELLYQMPRYTVLYENRMNEVQFAIYEALCDLDCYIDCELEYDDCPNLPKYIVDGINELYNEAGNLSIDPKDANLGWIGDMPMLFDFFLFER